MFDEYMVARLRMGRISTVRLPECCVFRLLPCRLYSWKTDFVHVLLHGASPIVLVGQRCA